MFNADAVFKGNEMDVSALLNMAGVAEGLRIELSGWLVDLEDGLYVMADHFPEDHDYPCRIRVENDGIMYPILAGVPSLVGGRSLLFYRARMNGLLVGSCPFSFLAETMCVEVIRGSAHYEVVDISPTVVRRYLRERGPYQFGPVPYPMRDWLEDV
ncbi:hypothetical protein [Cupriavidus plantarum]|uniref:hypothetical protein n=3 Tax=Cupriavidus plantarum TaxID=942865 RepID=UPI00339D5E1E